jgi:hypothetical protein
MKDGKNWINNFIVKLNGDVPFLDKEPLGPAHCKMCESFHIHGNYFEDYTNAVSHGATSVIQSDRKKVMKGYI